MEVTISVTAEKMPGAGNVCKQKRLAVKGLSRVEKEGLWVSTEGIDGVRFPYGIPKGGSGVLECSDHTAFSSHLWASSFVAKIIFFLM